MALKYQTKVTNQSMPIQVTESIHFCFNFKTIEDIEQTKALDAAPAAACVPIIRPGFSNGHIKMNTGLCNAYVKCHISQEYTW